MRIPYPKAFPSPSSSNPPGIQTISDAVSVLIPFLTRGGPAVVLTGAGLSVASNLSDYRGPTGTYRTRPNFRPILLHEFLNNTRLRTRYWSRSFLGFDEFDSASPNTGHRAIAHLMRDGVLKGVITQNVDSLHLKALRELEDGRFQESASAYTGDGREGRSRGIIELHGALRNVQCYNCGRPFPEGRAGLQDFLRRMNPFWEELKLNGKLISGPDGDVAPAGENLKLPDFVPPPSCESCGGTLKPGIVFFGENVPVRVKDAAEGILRETGKVLVLASSLATLSAWRLVKSIVDVAPENVAIVNIGGVRDEQQLYSAGKGIRIEADVQDVLTALMERLESEGVISGKMK